MSSTWLSEATSRPLDVFLHLLVHHADAKFLAGELGPLQRQFDFGQPSVSCKRCSSDSNRERSSSGTFSSPAQLLGTWPSRLNLPAAAGPGRRCRNRESLQASPSFFGRCLGRDRSAAADPSRGGKAMFHRRRPTAQWSCRSASAGGARARPRSSVCWLAFMNSKMLRGDSLVPAGALPCSDEAPCLRSRPSHPTPRRK